MIDITVELDKASEKKLQAGPKEFHEAVVVGFRKGLDYLEKYVKGSFGSANKPKVRSGALKRSIHTRVISTEEGKITGIIGSNLVYAAIQEYGGRITPTIAKYLHFQINGKWVRTKLVVIPPRPYLEPGVRETQNKVKEIIDNEVMKWNQRGQK